MAPWHTLPYPPDQTNGRRDKVQGNDQPQTSRPLSMMNSHDGAARGMELARVTYMQTSDRPDRVAGTAVGGGGGNNAPSAVGLAWSR